ncbi:MAG TPA: hypothetical protein PLO51_01125 [Candidatus Micrarchaeota archaeon]|nr:hypothetical protein [Candidatus Micrarchaeota archaeon]
MADSKQLFGLVIASLAFTLVFFVGIIMFSGMDKNSNAGSGTVLANAITANSIAPQKQAMFSVATAYKSGKFSLGNGVAASPSNLYYFYFPAGSAKGNPNDLAVIAGSNFVSEVIGLKAAGVALAFSPKPCAQSSDSDFTGSSFFAHPGAIEVSAGQTVCAMIKGNADSKTGIKVTGLNADSIQFSQ